MSFKTQLALFVLMYGFDLDGFAMINMNIFVPNETETQDCPLSRCTSSCPRVNHDTLSHRALGRFLIATTRLYIASFN